VEGSEKEKLPDVDEKMQERERKPESRKKKKYRGRKGTDSGEQVAQKENVGRGGTFHVQKAGCVVAGKKCKKRDDVDPWLRGSGKGKAENKGGSRG